MTSYCLRASFLSRDDLCKRSSARSLENTMKTQGSITVFRSKATGDGAESG